MILSPGRNVAGDGGVGVICTDMAVKATEWARLLCERVPGGSAEEHLQLGHRHQEQLERVRNSGACGVT